MRHLTSITGKSTAESFVAFLLTKDISTHVEPVDNVPDQWDIWIRDEDKANEAREELKLFEADPNGAKYRQAVEQAKSILKEQRQKSVERVKNVQRMPMRPMPNMMMGGPLPPLTLTIIILCVLFGLACEFNDSPSNAMGRIVVKQLSFVEEGLFNKTKDPAASIKRGELWRIITPAFLHGGPLHLLLNMLSLASLGRMTERLEGSGKFALILLISAIVAHLFQGLMPAALFGSPFFVGISGVVLGLFGFLAVKTTLRPEIGFIMPAQSYMMVGLILVLGFASAGTKGFELANLAHLGGLIAGAGLGFVMSDRRFD